MNTAIGMLAINWFERTWGFVVSIARRYQRRGGSFADVVAEGNLGLMHAANKFEPERGHRFATYAQYWVRVYASRCAIRAGSAVPAPRSTNRVRLEQERAQRLVGNGLAARELVAKRLGRSLTEIEDTLSLLERRTVSLEVMGAERHGAADPLLFAQGPSAEQAMIDQCEVRARREAVRATVAKLSPRERRIAERRLMAEPESTLTLEQLGTEFRVSRERVRQLEVRLKQKLASQLPLVAA